VNVLQLLKVVQMVKLTVMVMDLNVFLVLGHVTAGMTVLMEQTKLIVAK